MKKFDLVRIYSNKLGIIVSDLMDIPYIRDGCGSANFEIASTLKPEDFDVFQGYLIFTMPEGGYEVCAAHSIKSVDLNCPYDRTSIYDHATSGMRYHLTLLKLLEDNKKEP